MMSYILSIETATTNCSVSLSQNGKTIVLKEDNNKNYSHAESLHIFIDRVLTEAGVTGKQLDAIAVSKGPGSYTGLRIGVSAAKGLCFALDVPLIAVPTLEVLAHEVIGNKGIIIPMLDARRLEVYTAIFNSNYNEISQTEAKILDENAFAEELNQGSVYFVGNGVEKTKALISHPNAYFVENKLPSANNMSVLAFNKFKQKDFEDVAYFEPYYLKDFVGLKSVK